MNNADARHLTFIAMLTVTLAGCVGFKPTPLNELSFKARAQMLTRDDVAVTTSVLTVAEAADAFGPKLGRAQVQPVWVEIDNRSNQPYWLILREFDANYFSAHEAATAAHGSIVGLNSDIARYFETAQLRRFVPPNSVVSGFIFGNLKLGTKDVKIRLVGEGKVLDYEYFLSVPGLRADWQRVDFKSIYGAADTVNYNDGVELRSALETFICCTTRKNGSGSGDPINMVVIGDAELLQNFVRAGWDETEIISAGSSWRTLKAFISGGEYKYSPISALYVFGRPQEISLQKARDSIHERNHLRLWLAPFTYRGEAVWMGAISRDIGVFWTTRTWNLTTHAIDSDIDEARDYVLEDLASTGGLDAFGFVDGVGLTPQDEPKENLLGTPWWTNGYRVVLDLAADARTLEEVDRLEWAEAGARVTD